MIFHLHLTHYNRNHTLHLLSNISNRIRFLWIWIFPSGISFAVDTGIYMYFIVVRCVCWKTFFWLVSQSTISIDCLHWYSSFYLCTGPRNISLFEFNWLIISMRKQERKKERSTWKTKVNRLMIIKWHLLKALAVNESNTCANAFTDNNNIQWWGVSSVRCLLSVIDMLRTLWKTKVFLCCHWRPQSNFCIKLAFGIDLG